MEPMRVTIEEVRRSAKEGLLIARIRAVSQERIHGAARAIIRMRIRLEDPGPHADSRALRRVARDEALRFLDIS